MSGGYIVSCMNTRICVGSMGQAAFVYLGLVLFVDGRVRNTDRQPNHLIITGIGVHRGPREKTTLKKILIQKWEG